MKYIYDKHNYLITYEQHKLLNICLYNNYVCHKLLNIIFDKH